MAAVLALTMTACGGGSSSSSSSGGGKEPQGGGTAAAADADCVYSSQQIVLEDEEEGFLDDMNVDSLAWLLTLLLTGSWQVRRSCFFGF